MCSGVCLKLVNGFSVAHNNCNVKLPEKSYVGSNPTPPTNMKEGSQVVKGSSAKKVIPK